MSNELYHILLTFDIEDWFQVENFKVCIPFSSWSSYELRVEKNTHRLLDLLESIETKNTGDPSEIVPPRRKFHGAGRRQETGGTSSLGSHSEIAVVRDQFSSSQSSVICPPSSGSPKATFFVLGWIAERLPGLVREILARGHEVASHGYCHELCNSCTLETLKSDLINSRKLLEDIIGAEVYGYRAPSFSIDDDILKIIEDSGYLYDSSFNSFGMHGRYGKVDLLQNDNDGIGRKMSKTFFELPISNLSVMNPFSYLLSAISSEQNRGSFVLPWGGGGYFRLIPFPLFRLGVKSILKKQRAYLFYAHPWEIDPEQPTVNEAPRFFRFRHYFNLQKTQSRLSTFLKTFKQCRFATCYQYLQEKLNEPVSI